MNASDQQVSGLSLADKSAAVSEGLKAIAKPGLNGIHARTLPHSIEAEESLLSCCLLDGADVLPRCIKARLTPDSFYDTKHGIVFERLIDLHARRLPIELAVVAQELKDRRQLDQVGGWAFLTQITNQVPTTAQSGYFIKKVGEQATVRELIRATSSVIEDCYQFTGDLSGLTDDLRRRLDFAISGPRTDDWPPTFQAESICADPPPIPSELIEGILYMLGTILISGPSKAHKTFAALDLAIAIASGERWLGHHTTKSPVLYLNLELQDFAITERIAKICAARGISPPANLHVWNLRGKTVTISSLSVQLPQKIAAVGAKAVCIDPHYKVSSVSGMEENSNDDQGNLLTLLEGICVNAASALILTHHFAKGDASAKNAIDRASGGGVFARWGDVMLTFTPHEDDDCMTVEMSLRNFKPVDPFVVRWEYPRWQRDDVLDPAKLKSSRGRKETISPNAVLDALGNNLFTNSEWFKAARVSETSFRRKRDSLVDSGKVVSVGNCYQKAK